MLDAWREVAVVVGDQDAHAGERPQRAELPAAAAAAPPRDGAADYSARTRIGAGGVRRLHDAALRNEARMRRAPTYNPQRAE
jgi:hypothetical protein